MPLHYFQHLTVLQVPQTKCLVIRARHHPVSIEEAYDCADTPRMIVELSARTGDWNDRLRYTRHFGAVDIECFQGLRVVPIGCFPASACS